MVTRQPSKPTKRRSAYHQDALQTTQAWNKSLAKGDDKLGKLAEKIRADHQAGKTKPLDRK